MNLHSGFTMAEILLSLTIIGVIAAITLPSLTGNINERTWNTQRKALYARVSQAVALMPSLNGYGTLTEGDSSTSAIDTATETFITSGLAKVMKINNICDNEHLKDCGIVNSFTNMAGSVISMPTTLYELSSWFESAIYAESTYSTKNTKATAFETQNGESIVAFYNPSCRTEYLNQEYVSSHGNVSGFPQESMCVNFIYDLNGNKGPDTVGKDIGIITVFNATDSIVIAPMPSSSQNLEPVKWEKAAKACTNSDKTTRLPNIDELSSMLINTNIINLSDNMRYWSSSVYSKDKAWNINTTNGARATEFKIAEHSIRCIKR